MLSMLFSFCATTLPKLVARGPGVAYLLSRQAFDRNRTVYGRLQSVAVITGVSTAGQCVEGQ